MSRVFFGGNGPIHWRTTCAQAYAGVIFWAWFASARAFARLSPGYARDPE